MFAHINTWRLNSQGSVPETASAETIAARLRDLPGFQSYALVRTGEHEAVAITMFDDEEQLVEAMRQVADLVRDRVDPLTLGVENRQAGEVLYHLAIA